MSRAGARAWCCPCQSRHYGGAGAGGTVALRSPCGKRGLMWEKRQGATPGGGHAKHAPFQPFLRVSSAPRPGQLQTAAPWRPAPSGGWHLRLALSSKARASGLPGPLQLSLISFFGFCSGHPWPGTWPFPAFVGVMSRASSARTVWCLDSNQLLGEASALLMAAIIAISPRWPGGATHGRAKMAPTVATMAVNIAILLVLLPWPSVPWLSAGGLPWPCVACAQWRGRGAVYVKSAEDIWDGGQRVAKHHRSAQAAVRGANARCVWALRLLVMAQCHTATGALMAGWQSVGSSDTEISRTRISKMLASLRLMRSGG